MTKLTIKQEQESDEKYTIKWLIDTHIYTNQTSLVNALFDLNLDSYQESEIIREFNYDNQTKFKVVNEWWLVRDGLAYYLEHELNQIIIRNKSGIYWGRIITNHNRNLSNDPCLLNAIEIIKKFNQSMIIKQNLKL